MPVLGLGTDIAEIERIEKALSRSGEAFAKRILTESEMSVFLELKQQGRYLAKRFAAKEAASKALGTGIAQGISFQDFHISNDEHGKPILRLSNKALERAEKLGVANIHLTISDERHYAVATVLLES
ncbi:holo-ACP synthase [Vibrio sp. ZSDE26]|uniref:Holo-[acyl-carrier-protein] synthase n=1 Tax=Vibrio amylolyticus TaxID=2847292 RepID=A0A9X1XL21_9VIBR|nr:holo-ACP synthase [Vibrio amylolyticus]MCK6264764.1 holo-ACP synthase [Vibrio amylolyticus]